MLYKLIDLREKFAIWVYIRNNKSCPVRNLSKDTYLDTKTEEVKQKKKTESRYQSPKSVRKSMNRLMDLIRCNAIDSAKCKWLTVTYADVITDGKQAFPDAKLFLRKLKKYLVKQDNCSDGQKICSTKTCTKIWDAIASDKVKDNDFQDARDMVTLGIVSDIKHYNAQLAEVDKQLEKMYEMLGCTLTTIPGVNLITAVKILAEVGDIRRFPNKDKLAQFAGIAPLKLSSSGKGKDLATK